MKKFLSILLISAMLLTLVPMVVFADTTPTGTAISTVEQLKAMSGATSDSYYLANDITISGTWNFTTSFGSDLDGNGHTIYFADGVSITGGLFNAIKGDCHIKNLNIVQLGTATYTAVNEGIGLVAASARGEGEWIKVSNVSVYANISGNFGNNNVAGLIGDVRSCKVDMNRCSFDGSIKNTVGSGDKGAAGMIGGTWATVYQLYITQCVNYADITAGTYAAGIFGANRVNSYTDNSCIRDMKIEYCMNYGDITSTGSENAGGMFAVYRMNKDKTVRFRNNVNYGTINASSSNGKAGGIGGNYRGNTGGTSQLMGNVNYGVIKATTNKSTMVANVYGDAGFGSTQLNYCSDTASNTHGSKGTHFTDAEATAASLNNSFGSEIFTMLPNGKMTLTWAKEAGYGSEVVGAAETAFVGAQLSGSADDATRSVRFVGGLDEEFTNLDEVGVMIIATFGDGQRKVFEGQTATVYTSVLADGQEVLASENGVDYFYTAIVTGIPTELGNVTFEVFTYQLADGAVAYSNSTTLTVNIAA